jgi:hypothetical protein
MHPFIAEQLIADRRAQALAEAHESRLARALAADRPLVARPRLGPRWRRRLCVGIVALVATLVAFASSPAASGPGQSTSPLEVEPVTLVGLRAVASERVSYEPGASRTWSPGPQVVGVKVLSGRLTVYGGDGEPRVYVAGEGYAAGWAAYRTVNETDQRVETLVTNHVRT